MPMLAARLQGCRQPGAARHRLPGRWAFGTNVNFRLPEDGPQDPRATFKKNGPGPGIPTRTFDDGRFSAGYISSATATPWNVDAMRTASLTWSSVSPPSSTTRS